MRGRTKDAYAPHLGPLPGGERKIRQRKALAFHHASSSSSWKPKGFRYCVGLFLLGLGLALKGSTPVPLWPDDPCIPPYERREVGSPLLVGEGQGEVDL